MSAWYVFAAMGLYPEIPAVGAFAVTGTLFPNIKLNLDGGRQIIIRAKNAGQDAPYIKSMSLNKTRCQQTWLTLEQLTECQKTVLDFTMGPKPDTSWGADYRPPSFEPKE
jgi:putative alpha-1,2-mannosidase